MNESNKAVRDASRKSLWISSAHWGSSHKIWSRISGKVLKGPPSNCG